MSTISHNPELLAALRQELSAVIDTYVSGRTSARDRSTAYQAIAEAVGYLVAQSPDVAAAPTVQETAARISAATALIFSDACTHSATLVAHWDRRTGRARRR